ncbi:MAG: chloramphenicol acetyltransferase [Oscillospiraceae bacterium]|jgi:chloramphenicol O-acetyltransferase type A|nr:chloramphenicol acetyltransferase [Oscillospiraceae bacterium]
MLPNCTKINFDTWSRTAIFRHFIDDVRCVISVTADIDVTNFVHWNKNRGLRFFPSFLYVVSKAVNKRSEFRFGYDENGEVVVWDSVNPSYADFRGDDGGFASLVSNYSPDFEAFYRTVTQDMDRYKDKHGFEVEFDRRNVFDVSCLPWLHYKSVDMHVFDNGTWLAPVITWGKYEEKSGRILMPLSMQIHHAVADGFHIARFFADVEDEVAKLIAL